MIIHRMTVDCAWCGKRTQHIDIPDHGNLPGTAYCMVLSPSAIAHIVEHPDNVIFNHFIMEGVVTK